MNDRFTTRLGPGQALTLAAAPGPRRLVVTSGRLWLTFTRGTDDHWLRANEHLTLPAWAEVVAEAWPDASFQLLQPVAPRRQVRAVMRRWLPLGQGA